MFLQEGDKLLISHRRRFDHDETRHFLGVVIAYELGLAKVCGFSFVRDVSSGKIIRKDERRTKIIPLTSSSLIIYELPQRTDVDGVLFDVRDGELCLTDGGDLHMNMTELVHAGHI